MTFSEWFRKQREAKGQTQGQTAKVLRLSSPTISRWESGTEPRASHLIRVQRWGGIKAERLLRMVAA